MNDGDVSSRISYKKVYAIITNGKDINGAEWNGEAHLFHRTDYHEDGSHSDYFGIEFKNAETFRGICETIFGLKEREG